MVVMRRNAIETLLGAFVLGCAVFFTAYVYGTAGRTAFTGDTIEAYFDRVDGVMIGTDVKIGGVKVGAVKAVSLDHQTYRARVVFVLEKGCKVPQDSSVEVVSESLLGGKYINLVPGLESTCLASGGTIAQTSSVINFESLISQFILASTKSDAQGSS